MASDNNTSILDLSQLTPEEIQHEAMCRELNDLVGNYIANKYPGYPWGVASDIRNGVVNIFLQLGTGTFDPNNPDKTSRAPLGVTIRIDAQAQVMLKNCERYCGELLERYGLNRGRMIENEIRDALGKADFAGRLRVDEG